MIVGFFRLIFYALVAYLIYKFVMYVLGPRTGTQAKTRSGGRSGAMVKDEVCNTYLPKEDAIRETLDGVDRYFCSQECRSRFLAERKGRGERAGRTSV